MDVSICYILTYKVNPFLGSGGPLTPATPTRHFSGDANQSRAGLSARDSCTTPARHSRGSGNPLQQRIPNTLDSCRSLSLTIFYQLPNACPFCYIEDFGCGQALSRLRNMMDE